MTLYNIGTSKLESNSNTNNKKVETYVKVNKKIRQMRCHAPLIPQYMKSKNYKGKGLGQNEQGIKELHPKMFKANEGKNVLR